MIPNTYLSSEKADDCPRIIFFSKINDLILKHKIFHLHFSLEEIIIFDFFAVGKSQIYLMMWKKFAINAKCATTFYFSYSLLTSFFISWAVSKS